MALLSEETFVCLDCETTGLDTKNDRIIEIAATKFTFSSIQESKESLVNPQCDIPPSSQEIHNISQEMVKNQPSIKEILPSFLKLINKHILVGHGIAFDIAIICEEAKRNQIPCSLHENISIDTLRLARLYGESPINSLEQLRSHFNIEPEGAHRAMSDVIVNIEVFKFLTKSFQSTEQIFRRLEKPILLRTMPLGKHKGRKFSEIPFEYLLWAANKDFDQDLLFSLRSEIKNRKKNQGFNQASNPFANLDL
jgi:DNA polymerase-3 subunit epsilon